MMWHEATTTVDVGKVDSERLDNNPTGEEYDSSNNKLRSTVCKSEQNI